MFEPLLLEEAGAQVLRGIEEGVVIEPHESVVAACTKVQRQANRLLTHSSALLSQQDWASAVNIAV